MKPQIIKEEKQIFRHRNGKHNWDTPYMLDLGDGLKRFIMRLLESEQISQSQLKENRNQTAKRLRNLRNHAYKYVTFYCEQFDCPLKLIEWIKENNYSFDSISCLFDYDKDNMFCDFKGCTKEQICCFHFRIYDKELLKQIIQKAGEIKNGIKSGHTYIR